MKTDHPIFRIVPGGGGEQGRAWLITFTDLICLLLTFFVMLYAMSDPDPRRYSALATAISGSSAVSATGGAPAPMAPGDAVLNRELALDLGYLARVFESQIAADPALAGLTVARREGEVVLSMPADLLFASDSATLTVAGVKAVALLGGIAANIGNAIDVVGHSDPRPPGRQWPSNWELSMARAAAVTQAMVQAGYTRDVIVRGHGDGRFAAIDPNLTEAERLERARRVDLVVRSHKAGGEQRGLP